MRKIGTQRARHDSTPMTTDMDVIGWKEISEVLHCSLRQAHRFQHDYGAPVFVRFGRVVANGDALRAWLATYTFPMPVADAPSTAADTGTH